MVNISFNRIGSLTRKMFYREYLIEKGISDVDRVEKFEYIVRDGIYIHDKKIYFLEVKNFIDRYDIELFNKKCSIALDILKHEMKREYLGVVKKIIAINIAQEALDRAHGLGIEALDSSIV